MKWIIFPTQSSIVVFSFFFFCHLLHSLTMWLIVSSLSQHNLLLLFCSASSIFVLISYSIFCAAIIRDSVSLLRFPFRSQVQVFSYAISPVCRVKCEWQWHQLLLMRLVMILKGLAKRLEEEWWPFRRQQWRYLPEYLKSYRNLRRFDVIQIPLKDHQR